MHEGLPCQLVEISRCYAQLAKLVGQATKQSFTTRDAVKMVNELRFKEDPLILQAYIQARLKKNDLNEIFKMKKSSISPFTYNQIFNCHPIGSPIERSFSIK